MSDIINATRQKVGSLLKAIYGANYETVVEEVDDAFIIKRGSAAVTLTVKPLFETDCIVHAIAYVVKDARIDFSLLHYLMRLNAGNPIGAFGITFDNTITFSHGIAGANLDLNELKRTIEIVSFVADETDDMLREEYGGLRMVDANAAIIADAIVIGTVKKKVLKKAARKAEAKKAASDKAASSKKHSAQKEAPKKAAPKKAAPKKAASKKEASKKEAPKKAAPKKAALKKAAPKKAALKKAALKKTSSKKVSDKKGASKKKGGK